MNETTDLYFWLADEADEHKEEDWNNVIFETRPVVYVKGSHESSYQHKEDGAWAQDGASHQHDLQYI
jgi:hypothetical protein